MIDIRAYSGDKNKGKSIVRILQVRGSAVSLRRVVQEIVSICKKNGVLVEDALEVRHMESTFGSVWI